MCFNALKFCINKDGLTYSGPLALGHQVVRVLSLADSTSPFQVTELIRQGFQHFLCSLWLLRSLMIFCMISNNRFARNYTWLSRKRTVFRSFLTSIFVVTLLLASIAVSLVTLTQKCKLPILLTGRCHVGRVGK